MFDNVKYRSLAMRAWDAVFCWLVFTVLFQLLSPDANLLAVVALSQLAAATQAFFLERAFLCRNESDPFLTQFTIFQFTRLIKLALTALMVNGLSAQGVDPQTAMALALILLAACECVLGLSFPSIPNTLHLRSIVARLRAALPYVRVPLITLCLSLMFFELIWGRFYLDPKDIGGDFSLTGLGLLEGKYWLMTNGVMGGLFNPPWFTPAWCAGSAFYADPQSAFYSTLQLLALWIDPFAATHVNAIVMAAMGFVGSYLLAKQVFGWTQHGAAVFALIGIAHNFLPLRSAVGAAGYQSWALWPWLAFALCKSMAGRQHDWMWPSVGVAGVLTCWVQFGFAGMMIPSLLAVLFLCATLVLERKVTFYDVAIRLTAGSILGFLLNSSKIYESVNLMRQFPRDFYVLPGFSQLQDVMAAIALSISSPSEWVQAYSVEILRDSHFEMINSEWALSFGLGTIGLGAASAATLWIARRRGTSGAPHSWRLDRISLTDAIAMAGIAVLVTVPILLLWDAGSVRAMIKEIPILNSTTWPMRWIIIYVPAIQVLLALPLNALIRDFPSRRNLITFFALALVWLGPALEPLDYYFDRRYQAYDPRPVREAYSAAIAGGKVIPISHISANPAMRRYYNRNDSMLNGASQGFCYNPIYGYDLESLPQVDRLRDGIALETDSSGQSLLFNPACLVHPQENACAPGDGFRMADPQQQLNAQRFLARQPFEWQRPALGKALAAISQVTFWILLILIGLRIWNGLLRVAGERPPSMRDAFK